MTPWSQALRLRRALCDIFTPLGLRTAGLASASTLGSNNNPPGVNQDLRRVPAYYPATWQQECAHKATQHRTTTGRARALTLGASAGACCTDGAVSLYAQCAASPYSASRSMLLVRSCTSSGTPPGPRTAVCSDWYPEP